jgi:hypothetical protein
VDGSGSVIDSQLEISSAILDYDSEKGIKIFMQDDCIDSSASLPISLDCTSALKLDSLHTGGNLPGSRDRAQADRFEISSRKEHASDGTYNKVGDRQQTSWDRLTPVGINQRDLEVKTGGNSSFACGKDPVEPESGESNSSKDQKQFHSDEIGCRDPEEKVSLGVSELGDSGKGRDSHVDDVRVALNTGKEVKSASRGMADNLQQDCHSSNDDRVQDHHGCHRDIESDGQCSSGISEARCCSGDSGEGEGSLDTKPAAAKIRRKVLPRQSALAAPDTERTPRAVRIGYCYTRPKDSTG